MKTNILIKIPPFLNFHCEGIFWSKLSRASNNWIMIIPSALFNHLSVFSVSTFSFLRLFSSESIPFQGHFTQILWESVCPPGILLPFFYQAHVTCPLGNCDSPLLQDPIYPQIPEQLPSLPALHPTNSVLHQASTWPQMQKGPWSWGIVQVLHPQARVIGNERVISTELCYVDAERVCACLINLKQQL